MCVTTSGLLAWSWMTWGKKYTEGVNLSNKNYLGFQLHNNPASKYLSIQLFFDHIEVWENEQLRHQYQTVSLTDGSTVEILNSRLSFIPNLFCYYKVLIFSKIHGIKWSGPVYIFIAGDFYYIQLYHFSTTRQTC